MAKTQIYLSGAMGCYADTTYPKIWRDKAKSYFSYFDNFTCFAPTDFYDYGKKQHKTEKEIMRFELRKVKESDVILVNLKDIEQSVGTIDEVLYAYVNNISTVGFLECNENEIEEEKILHPWLYEQMDRIETGEDAMLKAMEYIKYYYW